MSEGKPLNELMAQLPAVTDASGKSVVLTDAQGELSKVAGSVLGVKYSKVNGGGAALLISGYALVYAVDTADPSKALVYTYSKPSAESVGKIHVILSVGGLEISASNAYGTVSLKGYSSSGNDVIQHVLRFT